MPLCPPFDPWHVEWERAAWEAAGQFAAEGRAKRELLLWRLHSLLAAWTAELPNAYEAALCRPDLPSVGRRWAWRLQSRRASRRGGSSSCVGRWPPTRSTGGGPRLRRPLNALDDTEGAVVWSRIAACCLGGAAGGAAGRVLRAPATRPRVGLPAAAPAATAGTHATLSGQRAAAHAHALRLLLIADTEEALAQLADLPDQPGRGARRGGAGRQGWVEAGAAPAVGFVALLDDGLVVTPHWLECLTALLLHDWPSVGLVGPAAQRRATAARRALRHEDLTDLDGFAARRGGAWSGRMAPVLACPVSCLLTRGRCWSISAALMTNWIRHSAVADLCLRVREAGLRLLLAQDVVLHHDGPNTTAGTTPSGAAVLSARWGEERVAPLAAAGDCWRSNRLRQRRRCVCASEGRPAPACRCA